MGAERWVLRVEDCVGDPGGDAWAEWDAGEIRGLGPASASNKTCWTLRGSPGGHSAVCAALAWSRRVPRSPWGSPGSLAGDEALGSLERIKPARDWNTRTSPPHSGQEQ
ncbi:hypothetical protein NDU88_001668 [Pleurodeles waltl]|uniref:Uncharacterized protein n=1 Tax=Pleurodeles waltl TaxID=8319 RepID=A0AAV7R7S7_PLEWA|nr:hypothetical protein NDU88_001668 [Pleurodeles waltl]